MDDVATLVEVADAEPGKPGVVQKPMNLGDVVDRWRDRIIEAFEGLGGQASYNDLYASISLRIGRDLTPGETAGIRREIENHSSNSKNWKPSRPDIFYSIKGLGSGTWGLRSHMEKIDEKKYIEGVKIARELQMLSRNKTLVERAKENYGLTCMICSFDFEKFYGALGKGFAECHHLDPLSGRDGKGTPTKITELAIVCANCHRMLHRRTPALSLAELRAEIQN